MTAANYSFQVKQFLLDKREEKFSPMLMVGGASQFETKNESNKLRFLSY